jgi:hypothetical protein
VNADLLVLTQPGSPGTQPYSLPPNFDPKAVLLWAVPLAADGTATSYALGMGFGTYRGGTVVQRSHSIRGLDGAGSSDLAIDNANDCLLSIITQSAGSAARDLEIDLVSMQTGATSNVVLDWVNLHSTASIRVFMLVIGGSDVTDALVGDFTTVTNSTTQDETVAAGFGKPDLLFALGSTDVGFGAFAVGIEAWCFGFAKQGEPGRMVEFSEQDGANAAAVGMRQRSDRLIGEQQWGGDLMLGRLDTTVANWPTDGFRIIYDSNPIFASYISYLAIRTTAQIATGSNSSPTAGTPPVIQDNALGFTPAAAMMFGWGWVAQTAIKTSGGDLASFGIGATDGTDQAFAGITSDDQAGTMNADSEQSTSRIFARYNPNTTALLADATGSFSGTNFRLAWQTIDAAIASDYQYIAFEATAGGSPQTVDGGVASESDSAPTATIISPIVVSGGTAAESDAAPAGSSGSVQVISGGTALESDSAAGGTGLLGQSVTYFDTSTLTNNARPPAYWRPFGDNESPFNKPLPETPALYDDGTRTSASIISYLSAQTNPTTLGFNYGGSGSDFHHPWYFATTSDDLVTIDNRYDTSHAGAFGGNFGAAETQGAQVYVPHDALPAGNYSGNTPQADGHMHVVQPDGTLVTMYKVELGWTDGGTLFCRWSAFEDLTDDGIAGTGTGGVTGSTAAGYTGAPMLRAEEMIARNVQHALFGTSYRVRGFVYPALKSGSETTDTHAPPMGARLRYGKTFSEIDAMAWPTWVKDFMKVLRRYGVFIGDTGGGSLATAALTFKIESDQVYRSFPGTYSTPNPWEQWGIDNSVPSRSSTLGSTVPSRTVYELFFSTYGILVSDFEVLDPAESIPGTVVAGGVAGEQDVAAAATISQAQAVAGGVASESDSGRAGVPANPAIIQGGVAVEQDDALSGSAALAQLVTGGVAPEADSALPGSVVNPATILGQAASESDSARAGSSGVAQAVTGGTAAESDDALAGSISNPATILGGAAAEDDSAPAGSLPEQPQVVAGGVALESDSALVSSATNPTTYIASPASESDSAVAGVVSNPATITAGVAAEGDSTAAGAVSNPFVVSGGRALEDDLAVGGVADAPQAVLGGVAVETDTAPPGALMHFMLPRIDLPTFMALDPQTTSVTIKPAPQTTLAIRKTETLMVVEGYEADMTIDSSVTASAQIEPQDTTISIRRTEGDMDIEPYEAGVELDAQETGVLLDA